MGKEIYIVCDRCGLSRQEGLNNALGLHGRTLLVNVNVTGTPGEFRPPSKYLCPKCYKILERAISRVYNLVFSDTDKKKVIE